MAIDKSKHEQHPFKWYVPKNARCLIIGTFPPVMSRWGFKFFYPNPRNLFWKVLADVRGIKLNPDLTNAVSERKKLLNELKTGVTDMGGTINRLSQNSLDENLELIEHMDIFSILGEHPSIERILLTSSSGKVSALAWFKQYLQLKNVAFKIPKGEKPLDFEINYGGRKIKAFVMYSPSPRASNRISYGKLVEMYRKVIEY